MHTDNGVALKINLASSLLKSAMGYFQNAFSLITLRIFNIHNKSPKIYAFDMSGIKCCLRPYMHDNAVKDDTYRL